MGKQGKCTKNKIIVADTNILINFLKIDRVDLIEKHSHEFVITDHVLEEIVGEKFKEQKRILINAIDKGIFTVTSLDNFEVIKIFANLESRGVLGTGECSVISYAVYNGCKIAMDDRLAIKHAANLAQDMNTELTILTTLDIMISLIKEECLNISEADTIKSVWENQHRFKLKIKSFGDVI